MSAVATDDRRNMTPFDEVVLEIDTLYDEAKNWADGSDIENDEQHEAAKALYDALHEAGKKADALRVEEKKPLDDAVKAIQDRFNPYIQPKKGKVDLGKSALNDVLAKWRKKVAEEKAAKAAEAARIAEEERQKAIEAMRASAGDLEAREAAEAQLETAKEAEAFAKRENKRATTGLGLRTVWVTEMIDPRAAVAAMWKQNPQAFVDLAQELAERAVRNGAREIPGFEITEQKKAI